MTKDCSLTMFQAHTPLTPKIQMQLLKPRAINVLHKIFTQKILVWFLLYVNWTDAQHIWNKPYITYKRDSGQFIICHKSLTWMFRPVCLLGWPWRFGRYKLPRGMGQILRFPQVISRFPVPAVSHQFQLAHSDRNLWSLNACDGQWDAGIRHTWMCLSF